MHKYLVLRNIFSINYSCYTEQATHSILKTIFKGFSMTFKKLFLQFLRTIDLWFHRTAQSDLSNSNFKNFKNQQYTSYQKNYFNSNMAMSIATRLSAQQITVLRMFQALKTGKTKGFSRTVGIVPNILILSNKVSE